MKDMNKIFRKIARENHMTVDDVKKEISDVIDHGLNNPDPEIRKVWESMSDTGGKPTPEDVIKFMTQKVIEEIQRKSLS